MFSRLWPVMPKEFLHIRRDPRTLAVMSGLDASILLPQIGALALFGTILIVAATARFRKRLD